VIGRSRTPDPATVRAAAVEQAARLGVPAPADPELPVLVELVLAGLRRTDPLDPAPAAARLVARHLLDELAARAPGRAVEVRVPPYGAVQCVPGPRHVRGTPPAVVETDPTTWIRLAAGDLAWSAALIDGRVSASGDRADLSAYLPLRP